LSDGLIYSLGLTLAGVLLWICHIYLNLVQITWLAASLTVILLLVRLPMGHFYARGLEEMIRSDAINLDDFNDYQTQLPPESHTVIRELLRDGDRYMQIKGLDLAASLGHPSQFLPEVKALLSTADAKLRQGIVKLFSVTPDTEALKQFESLLKENNQSILRATALEILITNQYGFEQKQLDSLLEDRDPEIRSLAQIAASLRETNEKKEIKEVWSEIFQSQLAENTVKAIIRVVAYSNKRELVPLLEYMLPQLTADTKRQGLEALTSVAVVGDRDLAQVAVAELEHPEPLVRVAAFKLLQVTRCQEMLPYLTIGLGDRDPRVRQQAASTLAAYGKSGLSLAQESLSSANLEVVNTAIAAIGQVRTKEASDILFKYLAPEFEQVAKTRKWQQQIPLKDPSWQPLAIAIADYHQRLIEKVLYILSCLGHSRTVNAVTRILVTTDQRDLANAVEVLASLSHRRFVFPLMPLLEQIVKQEQPRSQIEPNSQWLRAKGYKLLLEALESKDRWIRIGALIALAVVPSALCQDSDPVVQSFAQQIFPASTRSLSPTNTSMNRLLLLKDVALFKNLSLDELFLIDKALEQEQVFPRQIIYTEGSWGSHLYIIAEGTIQIVKEVDGEQRDIKQLSKGEYFGEIALFDDAPRWDGAIALQDCTLLKLEKKRFISLIAQRPHIILEICRFLSKRLRETDKYRSSKKLSPPSELVYKQNLKQIHEKENH
jgi:CRP-like cAMP-binding protein/HEAT repeat protein